MIKLKFQENTWYDGNGSKTKTRKSSTENPSINPCSNNIKGYSRIEDTYFVLQC